MTQGQEVNKEEGNGKPSVKLPGIQRQSVSGVTKKLPVILKGFLWGTGFMGTTLLSAAVGTWLALYTPLSRIVLPFLPSLESLKQDGLQQLGSYSLGRPVNILVMGIDRVEGTEGSEMFDGRSDTMLLVRFDPTLGNQQVNMLSIPRDTQVIIPEQGLAKINDANVYGGGELAAQVVSETLNDVPVDRFVRLTTDTFKDLVDAVGGVNVFVPQDMKYRDETQDLDIDLEQGWQVLDGDQAEQFARFRGDQYGDIGRVQRQQVLLKALREKIQSPTIIPRLPNLISLIQENIDTNLSWEEMLALMNFSRQLEQDDLNMVMLPGRFSDSGEYNRSYWIIANQEKHKVMQGFFGVEPPLQVLGDGNSTAIAPQRLRIAIQNATGENGMAGEMSRYLSQEDFTNTYLARDYPDLLDQTLIIAQRGDFAAANLLREAIGMGRVESSSVGEIESDITIRVGRDWLQRENAE